MGKFNMYTMYDKIAKRGSDIFLAVNDEIADRQFKKTIEKWHEKGIDKESTKDLMLLNIGTYEMGENDKKTAIISTKNYLVAQVPKGLETENHSEEKKLTLLERLGIKKEVKQNG